MRTLADVKRRAVVGTRVLVVEHWYMEPGSVRTVTEVHSTGVRCLSTHDPSRPFWQEWPKARDVVEITGDEFAYNVVIYPSRDRGREQFAPVSRGIVRLRFLGADEEVVTP